MARKWLTSIMASLIFVAIGAGIKSGVIRLPLQDVFQSEVTATSEAQARDERRRRGRGGGGVGFGITIDLGKILSQSKKKKRKAKKRRRRKPEKRKARRKPEKKHEKRKVVEEIPELPIQKFAVGTAVAAWKLSAACPVGGEGVQVSCIPADAELVCKKGMWTCECNPGFQPVYDNTGSLKNCSKAPTGEYKQPPTEQSHPIEAFPGLINGPDFKSYKKKLVEYGRRKNAIIEKLYLIHELRKECDIPLDEYGRRQPFRLWNPACSKDGKGPYDPKEAIRRRNEQYCYWGRASYYIPWATIMDEMPSDRGPPGLGGGTWARVKLWAHGGDKLYNIVKKWTKDFDTVLDYLAPGPEGKWQCWDIPFVGFKCARGMDESQGRSIINFSSTPPGGDGIAQECLDKEWQENQGWRP